ncbi:hypothetical protein [Chitinasiproducens palmae]|uniref:hypothetical protein n=1 Tax=Chitinasiproducens palmae TaxID=1770053 RepID=UPI0011141DB6|nr:hypothetical protein [Chitinasiproducens palmae]
MTFVTACILARENHKIVDGELAPVHPVPVQRICTGYSCQNDPIQAVANPPDEIVGNVGKTRPRRVHVSASNKA